jgi:hypothetical protein
MLITVTNRIQVSYEDMQSMTYDSRSAKSKGETKIHDTPFLPPSYAYIYVVLDAESQLLHVRPLFVDLLMVIISQKPRQSTPSRRLRMSPVNVCRLRAKWPQRWLG